MKKIVSLFSILLLLGCHSKYGDLSDGLYADMKTDKGNILLKLHTEDVPITVANFVALAEGNNPLVSDSLRGKPYYNGLGFHRVIKDFKIESGDPEGDGSGGPGYQFFNEFPRDSLGQLIYRHDSYGVLSMVNSKRRTSSVGSQFFITHKPTPWLDGVNTVFGKVVGGMSVVDSIALYDMIHSVDIIRIGNAAKAFNAPKIFTEGTKTFFADLNAKRLKEEADLKALLENLPKDKATAKKTESGLRIFKLKKGNQKGKKFHRAQMASIHYTMRLEEGGKLIQSTDGREPFTFILDKRPMISGVTDALLDMREGDKVRLFIPSYLGYGERGNGPIPPNADLVFDVELLKMGK